MKPYEPNHTFTKKPSIPQLTSYCVLISKIIIFSACLQNNISSQISRVAFMVMYYFSFVGVLIVGTLTCCTDPADDYLKHKKNPENNASLFCHLCKCIVHDRTRHCKICNM